MKHTFWQITEPGTTIIHKFNTLREVKHWFREQNLTLTISKYYMGKSKVANTFKLDRVNVEGPLPEGA